MNTSEKLFKAMCTNPKGWHLRDLQTIARQRNISWRQSDGSHCVFTRNDGKTLPVPAHQTIKPVYVRKFVIFAGGVKK